MTRICVFAWIALLTLGTGVSGFASGTAPRELGRVRWQRDIDSALAQSKKNGKPVLALFQEIPGCATCQKFGDKPLSHRLLVEAIEDEFIPVAIYNNRPGKDARVLKRFGEPAWNNPVVRYLKADGTDVVPRRDRVWSTAGMALRMVAALEACHRKVPRYLRQVARPSTGLQTGTFAMSCYWDGEARLGRLDGVVRTRAGWHEGREVVEVVYDPKVIPYEKLVNSARKMRCATRVYAHTRKELAVARRIAGDQALLMRGRARDASASDQKFALKRTAFRHVPLTPEQAAKVNAALRLGGDPHKWLSPRQLKLLERQRNDSSTKGSKTR